MVVIIIVKKIADIKANAIINMNNFVHVIKLNADMVVYINVKIKMNIKVKKNADVFIMFVNVMINN